MDKSKSEKTARLFLSVLARISRQTGWSVWQIAEPDTERGNVSSRVQSKHSVDANLAGKGHPDTSGVKMPVYVMETTNAICLEI